MSKLLLSFLLSILVIFSLTATQAQPTAPTVNYNNEFALKVFHEIIKDEENIFFSPFSIETALAMLLEGAEGETREELLRLLAVTSEQQLQTKFKEQASFFANNQQVELSTANALWLEQTYAVAENYKNSLINNYSAEVHRVDFINKYESEREVINRWVEDKTKDKIKDLIPTGLLSTLTRLILTNAIYFYGNWAEQFKPSDTAESEFKLISGTKKKVQMMRLRSKETWLNYYEDSNSDYQVLELPYKGGELVMQIILPAEGKFSAVTEKLSKDFFKEINTKLENQKVEVYLPKFRFEKPLAMAVIFKKLGLTKVFNSSAELGKISNQNDLQVSEVVHKAFIDVSEQGTEAAAATAIIMQAGSAMPIKVPVFDADRPFVFLIKTVKGDNILFMGVLREPN